MKNLFQHRWIDQFRMWRMKRHLRDVVFELRRSESSAFCENVGTDCLHHVVDRGKRCKSYDLI